jgi:hypothetical protein
LFKSHWWLLVSLSLSIPLSPFNAPTLLSSPALHFLVDIFKFQLQPWVVGEAFSDGPSLGVVPCAALLS